MAAAAKDGSTGESADDTGKPAPTTIKKYANRRLYNTATSSYVTLDSLAQMVKDGEEFSVFDAKSGEDITRSVLTQIIFEEEAKGENLLPINFLRQLIGFYGNGMGGFVPSYLEMSLENLAKQQTEIGRAFGGEAALNAMKTMTEKNAAIFQNAMQMFQPFGAGAVGFGAGSSPETKTDAQAPKASTDELNDLRAQMEQMRKTLEAMDKKGE
jgi:polyhydroxyalkanoate synthesis repressor PhaR